MCRQWGVLSPCSSFSSWLHLYNIQIITQVHVPAFPKHTFLHYDCSVCIGSQKYKHLRVPESSQGLASPTSPPCIPQSDVSALFFENIFALVLFILGLH